jgi:hypothetical protein
MGLQQNITGKQFVSDIIVSVMGSTSMSGARDFWRSDGDDNKQEINAQKRPRNVQRSFCI